MFVEKAAMVLPEVATIIQNAGIKANIKSAQIDIAEQEEAMVSFIFETSINATIMALTVDNRDAIPPSLTVSLKF